MPIIIPDTYGHFAFIWGSSSFASAGAATTFGMGGPGEPTLTAEEAAEITASIWIDQLRAQMDSSITLVEVQVTTALQRAVEPVNLAGTAPRTLPPPNCTTLVKKTTQFRGRRSQGRNFWPGLLSEGDIDERGTISAPTLTSLQTIIGGWVDAMEMAIGHPFVILQGSEGETPPLSPPPVVISHAVQQLVASQRRRLRR
jgi:hypothetical protein